MWDTLKSRRLIEYISQDTRRFTRDVTFDEGTTYNKSRKRPAKDPEETEAPRIHDTTRTKKFKKKIEN